MDLLDNLTLENFLSKINLETIIKIFAIFVIGFLIIRSTRFIIKKLLSRTVQKQTLMVITKIISYTGYSVLIIILLSEMGIQLTAILGAAGILGLAIGVASQKSLGNIISGLFLVAEKNFEIGDVLRVGDKTGIVYTIDFLAITLKTFDNLMIRIPNETLISAEIVNITKFPIRRFNINFSLSIKEDVQAVMLILNEIATENALCLIEPKPFIHLKEIDDKGLNIQFGVWFEKTNYIEVKNAIMLELLRRFKEENISTSYSHIIIENSNLN